MQLQNTNRNIIVKTWHIGNISKTLYTKYYFCNKKTILCDIKDLNERNFNHKYVVEL